MWQSHVEHVELYMWQSHVEHVELYMWQSHVEIKYYSVTYFDHVTAFKLLYL